MSGTNIPFLDLVSPHLEMEEELVNVFRTALRNAAFIGGKSVQDFENAFAEFCDVGHCVGVGSGTDALRFALMAAGVSPGDSVLTVPNTFIATTEAISQAGAEPEFVDIDERTNNIDPEKLARIPRDEVRPGSDYRKTDFTPYWPDDYGRRPRSPLRTDGRHGSDSRVGRSVASHRGRRRLSGSWRGVLLAQGQSLGKGWIDGESSGLQLLPWQESGCLR